MGNLISIISVAVLSVIGNIAYFEYRTKKETSKDLLKQTLTKLLLPLYINLHVKEVSVKAWLETDNADSYEEFYSDLPTRTLSSVEKVIEENIYLANDKLHEACINFLGWAYRSDSNQRFQDMMNRKFDFESQDKEFKKFYEIVVSEYNKSRRMYLSRNTKKD
jgi:hypothetical protein